MRKDRVRKHHVLGLFLCVGLLIFLSHSNVCASEDPTFELTVTKGDSLINICEEYLENSEEWPEIEK